MSLFRTALNARCTRKILDIDAFTAFHFLLLLKIIATIHVKIVLRDPKAKPPLIWLFSCTLFLEGDRMALEAGNKLRFTPSYEIMRRHHRKLYEKAKRIPMHAKLSSDTLVHVARDNIDSRKVKNNPLAQGESREFHGIVLHFHTNSECYSYLCQQSSFQHIPGWLP